MDWRDEFYPEHGFLMRKGAGFRDEKMPPCFKKLCLTSTSLDAMGELLLTLSKRDDCWFVKLDAELLGNGMVRGRCFMRDEAAIVELWNEHKVTDTMLCTVQDDQWTLDHRPE